jgi:hypothetical protein
LSRFVERSRLRRWSGYSRCTQSAGRSSARQAARRAELAGKRDRLIKRRDWLRKQMLAGNYDDDLSEYEQDVRELGEEIRQVDVQLAEFQSVHPAAHWMGNGAGLREAWGARFDNDEKRTLIEDAFGHITVKAVGFRVRSFDPKRIELGVDFTAPGPFAAVC